MIRVLERIREVTYFAPDIDAYGAWLTRVLGAREVLRYPDFIQLMIGSELVTLHPSDEKGQAGPGGQVVYWLVSDIAAVVTCFEHNGGRRFRGPVTGVDGPRVAQVQDPWGNVWGLVEERAT